uniref:Uncharacterized protein n=1 Tax=Oryza punctata TaxID=4537 RepID=A0A0E0KYB7_ORYPU
MTTTMFRRAAMTAAPPSDSEVRVQKVDKLDLVFNILTKPTIYCGCKGKPTSPAMARRLATAGDHGSAVAGRKQLGGAGGTSSRGVVSIEDINKRSENYIRDRKRMFFGQN